MYMYVYAVHILCAESMRALVYILCVVILYELVLDQDYVYAFVTSWLTEVISFIVINCVFNL